MLYFVRWRLLTVDMRRLYVKEMCIGKRACETLGMRLHDSPIDSYWPFRFSDLYKGGDTQQEQHEKWSQLEQVNNGVPKEVNI